MTTPAPAITVAICTYRRAALLPATLASLAAVARPAQAWELLIVDNGCEPAVADLTARWRDRLPIRYESEPAVGVAHARNRAVAAAAAPVVLFADDDVQFDPGWLAAMSRAVAAHPECRFWGGRIQPAWQVPRPAWFDEARCPSLGDAIVRYDLGPVPRPWDPAPPRSDPPFYTANLALSVEAVRGTGLFDAALGHRGNQRGSGEDSWMIKSLAGAGARGWYAADALLHHPVEARRLTKPYLRRFAWRQGRVGVDMLRRERASAGESRRTPRWLYRRALGQSLAGCGKFFAGVCRGDPGLSFAGEYAAIFNCSKLLHALRR
jgi:glycosyltransferase involved in cell wall biosynthesis